MAEHLELDLLGGLNLSEDGVHAKPQEFRLNLFALVEIIIAVILLNVEPEQQEVTLKSLPVDRALRQVLVNPVKEAKALRLGVLLEVLDLVLKNLASLLVQALVQITLPDYHSILLLLVFDNFFNIQFVVVWLRLPRRLLLCARATLVQYTCAE